MTSQKLTMDKNNQKMFNLNFHEIFEQQITQTKN